MRFLTVEEVKRRQERQERLLWLAGTCAVVIALIALAACGPSDVQVAQSGTPRTVPVVPVTADKPVLADRFHNITTTTTTAPPPPPTTQAPTTTEAPVVAAAASEPVVAPSGSFSGSCGGWESLVASYFPGEVATACRVIMCESEGNPSAVSSTDDHGLAQINRPTWNKPGHHDPVADWIGRNWGGVYDPATNLEMARRIRSAYGWGMWSCY